MVVSAQQKEMLINIHNQTMLEKEMENDSVNLDKFYKKFEENFGNSKGKN